MVLGPIWATRDWFAPCPEAHNAVVTITYPDGAVLKATALLHEEDEIRAIAATYDDVLVFTRVNGTWISEEIEPVTIEFHWRRRVATRVPSEDECICPKGLAARLIQALLSGDDLVESGEDRLCAFSPAGTRVANQHAAL